MAKLSQKKAVLSQKVLSPKSIRLSLKDQKFPFSPDHLLTQVARASFEYDHALDAQKEAARKKMIEAMNAAMPVVDLEVHRSLAGSLPVEDRPTALELAERLIQEYNCQTTSEKMLVESIVSSYMRYLAYSRLLASSCFTSNPISHERNGLYAIYGKEADRAHRHYLASLSTLRQFKAPRLEVNIKTKTAFIAQNQQVNAMTDLQAGPVPYSAHQSSYEIVTIK